MPSFRVVMLSAVVLALLSGVGWFMSAEASDTQQVGGEAPKCIGITTSVLHASNPVITRVYRIFEDGTVETFDDGAPNARWSKLGG